MLLSYLPVLLSIHLPSIYRLFRYPGMVYLDVPPSSVIEWDSFYLHHPLSLSSLDVRPTPSFGVNSGFTRNEKNHVPINLNPYFHFIYTMNELYRMSAVLIHTHTHIHTQNTHTYPSTDSRGYWNSHAISTTPV